MITIDGERGEGGGQMVRSSLSLAALTGQAVTIENIRAGRRKPGLQRQHVTAVRAAAEICQGVVTGAEIGSNYLRFEPAHVRGGTYHFAVGTAGSATLVLQTVLPALLVAAEPSQLTLEGGTHNPWAPPFDFLVRAFMPLVERMGPKVQATLQRPGFYPAGGGRFTVTITPAPRLSGFELLERGKIKTRCVQALVANLPRHIAERECAVIRRKSNWPPESFSIEEIADARGPGNVVMIELASAHVTELVTSFGRKGVRAEAVAREAWREADAYLQADVPVGSHLADQLMLPLAISAHQGGGGGAFRTMALTAHSTTQIELLGQFLKVSIDVEREEKDCPLVTIRPQESSTATKIV